MPPKPLKRPKNNDLLLEFFYILYILYILNLIEHRSYIYTRILGPPKAGQENDRKTPIRMTRSISVRRVGDDVGVAESLVTIWHGRA
jgi:hypothetical protein